MEDLACFFLITRPEKIALWRAWPIVEYDDAGRIFPDDLAVPKMSRRHVQNRNFALDGKLLRQTSRPVKEWAPSARCALAVQTLEHHGN